jgi:hypothetical protein
MSTHNPVQSVAFAYAFGYAIHGRASLARHHRLRPVHENHAPVLFLSELTLKTHTLCCACADAAQGGCLQKLDGEKATVLS